ncbi:MAG TPA: hypothetical protein VEY12_04925 [Thermoplasmata archaeon]|nr:hypothetical protein [Thermoplasmata archaeon]
MRSGKAEEPDLSQPMVAWRRLKLTKPPRRRGARHPKGKKPEPRGRQRKFKPLPGGGLVRNPGYHDRRDKRRRQREKQLDRVDDADPGHERGNRVVLG